MIKNHGGFPLRGSGEGPIVSRVSEIEEQEPVTTDQPYISFVDEDATELPSELNQEMIERGLARASGAEKETRRSELTQRCAAV